MSRISVRPAYVTVKVTFVFLKPAGCGSTLNGTDALVIPTPIVGIDPGMIVGSLLVMTSGIERTAGWSTPTTIGPEVPMLIHVATVGAINNIRSDTGNTVSSGGKYPPGAKPLIPCVV